MSLTSHTVSPAIFSVASYIALSFFLSLSLSLFTSQCLCDSLAFAVIPHLNARIRGTKHSAHCLVISSLRLTINDHTEASDTEKKTCASPPNEPPSKPDVARTSSFFLSPLFSWSEDEHFSCSMVLHLICSNAKHVPTEPASNTQTSKKPEPTIPITIARFVRQTFDDDILIRL